MSVGCAAGTGLSAGWSSVRLLALALALVLGAGVESAEAADKQRLELSGRILLDADYYDKFFSKDADDNLDGEIRNARLQLEYDFPRKWLARLQLDLTDEDLDLGSAYLRYTGWDLADITLGKLKEPLGLERNTSASRLMTIEGSMLSMAFTPGKSWGVHLYNANKRRRWAAAVTVEDDEDDDYSEDPPMAVSGRYTWSPQHEENRALQFGFSASLRDYNDNVYQVRERAEVGTADNVVRSARFIAEEQQVAGVEALLLRGPLTLQTEYMATRVEEKGGTDWDYDGFYLMGSYFLSGAQRRFSKGEFKRLKPASGGAWEAVARYSEIDVRQRGLGSTSSVSTLGLNYYYNDAFRIMWNVLYADISGDTRHDETDGYATSLRLQLLL